MTIVGFAYTKINAERSEGIKGNIKIENNVAIDNIEPFDFSIGSQKQTSLKFSYTFSSKYEPNFGKIVLGGNLIYLNDSAKVKEILDKWKKDKKVLGDVMTEVINAVLSRCNVQALIMARDLNLPAPIPLPKVEVKK